MRLSGECDSLKLRVTSYYRSSIRYLQRAISSYIYMSTWITSYLCWGIVSDEAKHSRTDKLGLKDWRYIIWAKTMLETWAANTNSSKWTINYVMQMHFNILNAVIFSLCWPSPTDPHKSKQWLISRHVRHDELLHSYKTITFTKNKTKHMVRVALDIMRGCFSHFWWLMSTGRYSRDLFVSKLFCASTEHGHLPS